MKNPTVETDILIIGGGPAGLAASIHFADLYVSIMRLLGVTRNYPEIIPVLIEKVKVGFTFGLKTAEEKYPVFV